MLDLEDALNLGLPNYRVERIAAGDQFRAELQGYPQCTGFGPTATAALRVARHLFTQLRDGQAAVCVGDMQGDLSERLRQATRLVVSRALMGATAHRRMHDD